MENEIITAILIIIVLIGVISIGYLLLKIILLLKTHRSVINKCDYSPHFDLGTKFMDDSYSENNEPTLLLYISEEERRSTGRLEFKKIDNRASSRIELLNKEAFILGRASDVDIFIGDRMISRKHLQVSFTSDKWQIKDLGSSNGTFLNGERIVPGHSVVVNSESIVCIGRTEFSICLWQ